MLPGTFMFWSLLPLLLVSFTASPVAALHFTLKSQQMSCRPILMSSCLLQHVFTCLFFTSIQYKLIIIYFLQAHWLTTNCVDSTIFLSQIVSTNLNNYDSVLDLMFFIPVSAIMEYNRLCDKYDDVLIRAVGDKYGIPYTTFWKWAMGHVKGTGYQSGGKGYSKLFSEGMFWSIFYF